MKELHPNELGWLDMVAQGAVDLSSPSGNHTAIMLLAKMCLLLHERCDRLGERCERLEAAAYPQGAGR